MRAGSSCIVFERQSDHTFQSRNRRWHQHPHHDVEQQQRRSDHHEDTRQVLRLVFDVHGDVGDVGLVQTGKQQDAEDRTQLREVCERRHDDVVVLGTVQARACGKRTNTAYDHESHHKEPHEGQRNLHPPLLLQSHNCKVHHKSAENRYKNHILPSTIAIEGTVFIDVARPVRIQRYIRHKRRSEDRTIRHQTSEEQNTQTDDV